MGFFTATDTYVDLEALLYILTRIHIYIYRKRESLEFCLWIRVENPYLVASVQYSLGAS